MFVRVWAYGCVSVFVCEVVSLILCSFVRVFVFVCLLVWLLVCLLVCVCGVCVCLFVCVWMFVCLFVCLFLCVYLCLSIVVYLRDSLFVRVCLLVRVFVSLGLNGLLVFVCMVDCLFV